MPPEETDATGPRADSPRKTRTHDGGPVTVAGVEVPAGERRRIEIPVSRLPTETLLTIPVEVVNGVEDGPRLWISGAVHGDEVVGVEVIRQVAGRIDPAQLKGVVIAVPIVNVFGFINQSRYLPDRRDLNRSFPGTKRGSLASRLAHLFMTEIVSQCTHGIDYHTGSNHRTNLPQIRADLNDAETRHCAEAFRAPVILDTHTRDGSLREAATKRGIAVLLYEAGEPLRFDQQSIEIGVEGTLRVMSRLKMRRAGRLKKRPASREFNQSVWVRARRGGILNLEVKLGENVTAKQRIGVIADAFGQDSVTIRAPDGGVVIGRAVNPLVYRGDGIVHIATSEIENVMDE